MQLERSPGSISISNNGPFRSDFLSCCVIRKSQLEKILFAYSNFHLLSPWYAQAAQNAFLSNNPLDLWNYENHVVLESDEVENLMNCACSSDAHYNSQPPGSNQQQINGNVPMNSTVVPYQNINHQPNQFFTPASQQNLAPINFGQPREILGKFPMQLNQSANGYNGIVSQNAPIPQNGQFYNSRSMAPQTGIPLQMNVTPIFTTPMNPPAMILPPLIAPRPLAPLPTNSSSVALQPMHFPQMPMVPQSTAPLPMSGSSMFPQPMAPRSMVPHHFVPLNMVPARTSAPPITFLPPLAPITMNPVTMGPVPIAPHSQVSYSMPYNTSVAAANNVPATQNFASPTNSSTNYENASNGLQEVVTITSQNSSKKPVTASQPPPPPGTLMVGNKDNSQFLPVQSNETSVAKLSENKPPCTTSLNGSSEMMDFSVPPPTGYSTNVVPQSFHKKPSYNANFKKQKEEEEVFYGVDGQAYKRVIVTTTCLVPMDSNKYTTSSSGYSSSTQSEYARSQASRATSMSTSCRYPEGDIGKSSNLDGELPRSEDSTPVGQMESDRSSVGTNSLSLDLESSEGTPEPQIDIDFCDASETELINTNCDNQNAIDDIKKSEKKQQINNAIETNSPKESEFVEFDSRRPVKSGTHHLESVVNNDSSKMVVDRTVVTEAEQGSNGQQIGSKTPDLEISDVPKEPGTPIEELLKFAHPDPIENEWQVVSNKRKSVSSFAENAKVENVIVFSRPPESSCKVVEIEDTEETPSKPELSNNKTKNKLTKREKRRLAAKKAREEQTDDDVLEEALKQKNEYLAASAANTVKTESPAVIFPPVEKKKNKAKVIVESVSISKPRPVNPQIIHAVQLAIRQRVGFILKTECIIINRDQNYEKYNTQLAEFAADESFGEHNIERIKSFIMERIAAFKIVQIPQSLSRITIYEQLYVNLPRPLIPELCFLDHLSSKNSPDFSAFEELFISLF